MDWIEFVSKHSGSPFSPKMRHHNIARERFLPEFETIEQEIERRFENSASTLVRWLKATEQKISLDEALKTDKLNRILAVQKVQS